jgi:hypothetical protein
VTAGDGFGWDELPPRSMDRQLVRRGDTTNLADILERILDKGLVIAGDIVVSLVDVELLTIRVRLLIASVDKAREMGINWWEHDRWLSSAAPDGKDAAGADGQGGQSRPQLESRLERIEEAVERLASAVGSARAPG